MKTNMHKLDRTLRLVFSLVVAVYFFQTQGGQSTPLSDILFYLAILFGITGAVNFCPLYKLMGVDTSKPDQLK